MARLVRLDQTGPMKLEPAALPQDKPVWICQCGLSQKFPLCDGSHKISRAEQPGTLYTYSKDSTAVLSTQPDPACQPCQPPAQP